MLKVFTGHSHFPWKYDGFLKCGVLLAPKASGSSSLTTGVEFYRLSAPVLADASAMP